LREETVNNIATACDNPQEFTGCDPDDEQLEQTARQYDTAAKVLVGVGAGALAAGIVMWFVLAPEDGAPTTGTSPPKVSVAPTVGGLLLHGQF
jgi:hypothetical protein